MTSIAEAYDPETRWGRAFGVVDRKNYSPPDYKHRGQDIRKLGPGGAYSVVTDVVSLSAGRVSHQYTARATGREIVVDTGRKRGRYEIHCHNAYFPDVGLEVEPGQAMSVNATARQQPGTGWGGPHDHLVISDYPDAAHTPSRPVYDPRDFIRAALASAAGGSAKPLPEEDDMTPDQARQLQKVSDFVDRFVAVVNPWSGELGVDVSVPRIRQAVDASIDLRHRFVYRDAGGTPMYDLAQLTMNEIKPMLLSLAQAVAQRDPNGAAVDVEALLRESEQRTQANIRESLRSFAADLKADQEATIRRLLAEDDPVTPEELVAALAETYERAFAPRPSDENG